MHDGAMSGTFVDPASFRDPAGRVLKRDGRIFRTVTAAGSKDYESVRASGLIDDLAAAGLVLPLGEVDPAAAGHPEGARYVLESEALALVSYPYEWCFGALKAAALLHLEVHLKALERDVTLIDASAYNVQFRGARPVFIDHLSFRPYEDGALWQGHRQFCEQFLNPLLLGALAGVPHNAWLRGRLEGIPAGQLSRLLPWRAKFSRHVLAHVVLPARFEQSAGKSRSLDTSALATAKLPRASLVKMLRGLQTWIAGLEPVAGPSVWRDYGQNHSYSNVGEDFKRTFVRDFLTATQPALLWDLGCNTGDYAALALASGAAGVIGCDSDLGSVEAAFARARAEDLNFLPLLVDAADPSPSQGWAGAERPDLRSRVTAQALLALALVHHLAIGRNVPLDAVVDWLVGLAPAGIIEFVPKQDPMVGKLLALRADIFSDYHEEAFLSALAAKARIVRSDLVPDSSRRLVWFERS